MAFRDIYRAQVALLVRVLPIVAEETCFALKGGTAINLFVRDLPRLSVDIDLTYLPVASWEESLQAIDAAMTRIADALGQRIPGAHIAQARASGVLTRITLRADRVQIKIEVTPVLRGTVYDVAPRRVVPAVEEQFGFAEMQVVSFADLYGGKIVAALDRQHPRDLFDVKVLLENEGIDDALRRAFIVYLLSHNRPMSEVLTCRRKDIREAFAREFEGMVDSDLTLDELLQAREDLVAELVGKMPDEHRRFLLSFERGEPDWDLLGVDGAASLPAVLFRQKNLDSLDKKRREAVVAELARVLAS